MYQRCALAASVVIQSWTSMTLSTVSCRPPPTTRSTCWPNTGWGIRMSAGLFIHPSLEWNNTLHKHLESARRIFLWLIHPARWTLSSNWSENSFVMDVYENVFFFKSSQNFLSEAQNQIFLSHRQTLYYNVPTNQKWALFLQDVIPWILLHFATFKSSFPLTCLLFTKGAIS